MTVTDLKVGDTVNFCSIQGRWYYGKVTRLSERRVKFVLPRGSFTHNANATMIVPLDGLQLRSVHSCSE